MRRALLVLTLGVISSPTRYTVITMFRSAMRWFEAMMSLDGRLSGKEQSNRRVLWSVSVCLCIVCVYAYLVTGARGNPPLAMAGFILFVAPSSAIMLQCLCRLNITKRMMQVSVVLWAVAMGIVQIHNMGVALPPRWSVFVLVLDLVLLLQFSRSFSVCLVGIVLWVAFLNLDLCFRFGLVDLPGTSSREYRLERLRERYDCADPPCSTSLSMAVREVLATSFPLILDFLATRGFAEEAEKEQAAMARTIETVEAAAQLLAGYDVDTVAELLEAAEGRLPPAMHAALATSGAQPEAVPTRTSLSALFEDVCRLTTRGVSSVHTRSCPRTSESGEATTCVHRHSCVDVCVGGGTRGDAEGDPGHTMR